MIVFVCLPSGEEMNDGNVGPANLESLSHDEMMNDRQGETKLTPKKPKESGDWVPTLFKTTL